MQQDSQSLVQSLFDQNPRFRLLYEEHRLLEKDLDSLTRKSFLTPEEELEKRKLQKLKLAGKDEMERILSNYR
ncbi:YdcH family protein [Desulfuromonas sp. AOP6]|uniref:YdcH family protein n=1 Tax=Desulfuromonas sp. AOP6 TaxID=1566351 RepID=UPI00128069D2|nr:YdcH family protein [Desulfuromonas sp. AOP6]BCA79850.1 hypothetical protein AOP6_1637 [Desulfuromonas sp. AOP6]